MTVYLDNAATSYPKPDSVYAAMDRTAREIGVAPGRGGYRQSIEASRLLFETREALADLFGVTDSSRFIITHSATESLNLAVKGLLRTGDHVVTTTVEHNSLARPLHAAECSGISVTWVKGDLNGYVAADEILAAVRPDTRVVAMTHCSNVTGAVNPVAEIGAMLKDRGVILLVDAAQSAGSIPIDISAMNIGLFAAPGHKGLYGPQGTGILYVAPDIHLEPLLLGGTGSGSSELTPPLELPERFESGTLNINGIAGLLAGVEFIAAKGVANIQAHESILVDRLIKGLSAIDGVRVINPGMTRARGAVVSFTVSGRDPSTIGHQLDSKFDIAVRTGLHCAPLAHKTVGTFPDGTIRVSPGIFNSAVDIDALLAAVQQISAGVETR
jgi:cysteine desulfurase family protein